MTITDAPWVAVRGADGHWDIHHQSEGRSGGFFCRVASTHVTREALDQAAANARLIAAAPDLFEACENVLVAIGCHQSPKVRLAAKAVAKAIAKAKGQS